MSGSTRCHASALKVQTRHIEVPPPVHAREEEPGSRARRRGGVPGRSARVRRSAPGGATRSWEAGSATRVKRIEVLPQRRLSHQRQVHRAEHWAVVSGTAEGTVEGRTWRVPAGSCGTVPSSAAPRMANAEDDFGRSA